MVAEIKKSAETKNLVGRRIRLEHNLSRFDYRYTQSEETEQ